MLTLAYPWLLALAPLPLLAIFLLPVYRQSRDAIVVPFLPRLSRITGRKTQKNSFRAKPPLIQQIALWLVWLLLVLALARPQHLEPPVTRDIPTRDLMLAIDLSGSMETNDFTDASGKRVSRLDAVKEVLDDFLAQRKHDRVGLIFFGTSAFVQTTFTQDLDATRELLHEAQVRMAGPKTAFGDAIGLAITVFKNNPDPDADRVLIVLTDGNDTGSLVPPDQAAIIARDDKITIHTIAVGDPTAVGEEKLDEKTLRFVASTTGGLYSHANDRTDLQKIYAALDKLNTRPTQTISHRPRTDLFPYPLALALIIALAYHLLHFFHSILTTNTGTSTHAQNIPASLSPQKKKFPAKTTLITALLILSVFLILHFHLLAPFHFLRPLWFLAILPLFLVAYLIYRRQDTARPWRNLIAPHLIPFLLNSAHAPKRLNPLPLLLAAFAIMILALAGPAWKREPSPFASNETALAIALAVHPTMLAQDIQPSRLQRSVEKIHDLLVLRPDTRAALLAYAGSAHLAMPLTKDHSLIDNFASQLSPAIMPLEGNDLPAALALANEQIRKSKLPGSILLITDALDPTQIPQLKKLRAQNLAPVQILAAAAPDTIPLPPDSPPAPSLDLSAMRQVAAAINAGITTIATDKTDVQQLAARVVTRIVEKSPDTSTQRWQDEGYWLLYLGALITLLWFRPGWFIEWRK